MKSRKSWLRIVEAFLAVLLILSVVLIVISKQRTSQASSDEIIRMQQDILESVREDSLIRSQVLSSNTSGVEAKIMKIIPPWMNYSVNICNYSEVCPNTAGYIDKTVYSNEIFIAANLTEIAETPVKLKIFFWEK